MTSSYFTCTEDTAKQQALKNFQEEMSRQVTRIEDAADDFKVNAATFQEDYVNPMRRSFDDVISTSTAGQSASGNLLVSGQYQQTTPSEDLLTAIGLPTAPTKDSMEELLSARHDLHVISGQIIAPGEIGLTEAKLLYKRLDYNMAEFRRLLSQGHGWPFILVALHSTQTTGDIGTDCAPGRAAEDVTTVLGINENLETLAQDNNIPFSEITLELYWLEAVNTSPSIVRLLRGLKMTPTQIGFGLTEGASEEITTYVIEDPLGILDLLGLSDSDLDKLLRRDNISSANPDPRTSEVIQAAKDRLGSSFLDKDSNQIATMQPAGLLLAQTIDIRRFRAVQRLSQGSNLVNQELYYDEWLDSLAYAVAAVEAAFDALVQALEAFQAALEALLSPILSALTLVENLLNSFASGGPPLLECLFGAMSVNISLSTDFFDSLFDSLASLLDPFLDILKLLSDLMSLMGAPSCLLQSLLSALLDNVPKNPALECISLMAQYGFELLTDLADIPDDLWTNEDLPEPTNTFQALAEIADLIAAMIAEVQAMLRDLALWAHNIALNLDLEADERSEDCNPTTIIGLLAQMAIEELI